VKSELEVEALFRLIDEDKDSKIRSVCFALGKGPRPWRSWLTPPLPIIARLGEFAENFKKVLNLKAVKKLELSSVTIPPSQD